MVNKENVPEPDSVQGYQMDPSAPLHRLFVQRMTNDRDLKIIITADDSETGVGKTTCAGWLALSWNSMYANEPWEADTHACIDPNEFFKLQKEVGAGSVLILDDAEELDARRSMQSENVEFSQRWMLMRVLQQVHILTLPSPGALDSRLEELADVWINIERRGKGVVHDIRVNSYGSRKTITPKIHEFEFPNVAEHDELEALRDMKDEQIEQRMSDKIEEDETLDPDEVERQTKIDLAQKMRDRGMTIAEISNTIGMSEGWVSNNTTKQVEGVVTSD
jgi:hypothetical protein